MTENFSRSSRTQMFANASDFNIYGGIFNAAQNVNITHAGSAQVNVPPGYVEGMTHCPTSTSLFTGRKTILNVLEDYFIKDMLSEDAGRRKIFLLHGLGGAGKTQCALEFARKFNTSFTEICFIVAESEDSIKASYYDIAMRHASMLVQGWESGFKWFKTHKENWLIIMDNADNAQLNLGKFLPPCDHGNVIITSRNPDLIGVAGRSEEIKDMEPNDAMWLLLKHAIKRQATVKEEKLAGVIAKELHCFALALVQAGAYINQHKCLNNYLDLLKSQQAELLSTDISQSLDNYTMSIYATWNLSWNKLEENSKILLNICAYLHHERIPYALFKRAIENIEDLESSESVNNAKSFLALLATESMKWDTMKINEMIHKIGSYSLLNVIHNGLFSFHPLVHKWMMDRMDIDLKEDICLGAQGIVAASINGTQWDDISFVRLLTPHCIALEKHHIGELVIKKGFGTLWLMSHYATKALTYWKPIVEETKISLGEEHPSTLTHTHDLALTYQYLGRYNEALDLQRPLLEVSKQVMGEEHPATLSRTNNLALTYQFLGRYNEALDLQKPLLEVSKQVMGEEHPDTMTHTNNLAMTYQHLGRYNEALDLQKPLLEVSKNVMGEDHPRTLTFRHNLAMIYHDLEEHETSTQSLKPIVEAPTTFPLSNQTVLHSHKATKLPKKGIAARARDVEKQKAQSRTTQKQRVSPTAATSSTSQRQHGNYAAYLEKDK